MNDMITIFNQLTHNELADCNTFENIIVNHFRKFKLIYQYMKYLDLNTVFSITCKDSEKGLSIKINYKNGCLNNKIFEGIKSEQFTIQTSTVDNVLQIDVMDSGKSEVEIDENRFNRRKKVYSR